MAEAKWVTTLCWLTSGILYCVARFEDRCYRQQSATRAFAGMTGKVSDSPFPLLFNPKVILNKSPSTPSGAAIHGRQPHVLKQNRANNCSRSSPIAYFHLLSAVVSCRGPAPQVCRLTWKYSGSGLFSWSSLIISRGHSLFIILLIDVEHILK